ncbi:MAG: hypothetical protein ACFCGT_12490, partial [Sandaracinaceae bacterium]
MSAVSGGPRAPRLVLVLAMAVVAAAGPAAAEGQEPRSWRQRMVGPRAAARLRSSSAAERRAA